MKNTLVPVLLASALLAGAPALHAQMRIASKGAKPGEWTTDFEAAKQTAAEKNLPIFLMFTSSDNSCPYVRGAPKGIFDQREWDKFAKNNLVTVLVDNPEKKAQPDALARQNKGIAEKYGNYSAGYILLESDAETKIANASYYLGKTQKYAPEYFSDLVKFHLLSARGAAPVSGSETAPAKPPARPAAPNAIKPVLEGAEPGVWTMDYEAAKQTAAEKQLPILLFFTGSDWNSTAQSVVKRVFNSPAFDKFAKENNLMLVWADFPEDASLVPEKFAAQNRALFKDVVNTRVEQDRRWIYPTTAFPVCVLLDSAAEKKLATLDHKLADLKTVRDFTDYVKPRLPKKDTK